MPPNLNIVLTVCRLTCLCKFKCCKTIKSTDFTLQCVAKGYSYNKHSMATVDNKKINCKHYFRVLEEQQN